MKTLRLLVIMLPILVGIAEYNALFDKLFEWDEIEKIIDGFYAKESFKHIHCYPSDKGFNSFTKMLVSNSKNIKLKALLLEKNNAISEVTIVGNQIKVTKLPGMDDIRIVPSQSPLIVYIVNKSGQIVDTFNIGTIADAEKLLAEKKQRLNFWLNTIWLAFLGSILDIKNSIKDIFTKNAASLNETE